MFDDKTPYTFDRVVRMILTAAVVIGVFLLLRYLSDVLVPFVAAVVLAYILNPVVTEFERRFKRRSHAVAFTLAGLCIVALAISVILVPLMYAQVGRFRESLQTVRAEFGVAYKGFVGPDRTRPGRTSAGDSIAGPSVADPTDDTEVATSRVSPPPRASQRDGAPATSTTATTAPADAKPTEWEAFKDLLGIFGQPEKPLSVRLTDLRGRVGGTIVGRVLGDAAEFMESEEFGQFAVNIVRRLFASGVTVISFAVETVLALTVLIIVLIYLIFLLVDYPDYVAAWKEFLPPGFREDIVEFLREFEAAMRRYFRGQFIIASITGAMFAVGFTIIGLPMAIPFGLFVGVLNMVPYLQAVAIVPAGFLAILRALEGDNTLVGSFGWVLLIFAIAQVLQDAVITPRIMGKATGLKPVAILLGVFVWGKLLGFLGLLLAIPLTCLGIAYYRRFVLKHSREATTLADESG